MFVFVPHVIYNIRPPLLTTCFHVLLIFFLSATLFAQEVRLLKRLLRLELLPFSLFLSTLLTFDRHFFLILFFFSHPIFDTSIELCCVLGSGLLPCTQSWQLQGSSGSYAWTAHCFQYTSCSDVHRRPAYPTLLLPLLGAP